MMNRYYLLVVLSCVLPAYSAPPPTGTPPTATPPAGAQPAGSPPAGGARGAPFQLLTQEQGGYPGYGYQQQQQNNTGAYSQQYGNQPPQHGYQQAQNPAYQVFVTTSQPPVSSSGYAGVPTQTNYPASDIEMLNPGSYRWWAAKSSFTMAQEVTVESPPGSPIVWKASVGLPPAERAMLHQYGMDWVYKKGNILMRPFVNFSPLKFDHVEKLILGTLGLIAAYWIYKEIRRWRNKRSAHQQVPAACAVAAQVTAPGQRNVSTGNALFPLDAIRGGFSRDASLAGFSELNSRNDCDCVSCVDYDFPGA